MIGSGVFNSLSSASWDFTSPSSGATYYQGQVIDASYTCTDGSFGPGLLTGSAGCSGTVARGAAISTAALGAHTFTVTATSADGQSATASVAWFHSS